jgi:hypothetical protein
MGEGVTDTCGKIKKVFGNDSVSRAQVFRWHKDFVNGREMVEDEPRYGRHYRLCENKHKRRRCGGFLSTRSAFENPNYCRELKVQFTKLLHEIWTW